MKSFRKQQANLWLLCKMINFAALLCHEHLHRVKDGIRLSELDCSVNTHVVQQGQLCSVFAVVSKPTAVIKVKNHRRPQLQEFVKQKNRHLSLIGSWELLHFQLSWQPPRHLHELWQMELKLYDDSDGCPDRSRNSPSPWGETPALHDRQDHHV